MLKTLVSLQLHLLRFSLHCHLALRHLGNGPKLQTGTRSRCTYHAINLKVNRAAALCKLDAVLLTNMTDLPFDILSDIVRDSNDISTLKSLSSRSAKD